MAREIEAKIRLAEPGPVRARLAELRASRLGRVLQISRIFDTRDRRLRAGDCGLRLRESRPLDGVSPRQTTLTFKGPRDPAGLKSRDEIETRADDAAALAAILQHLGFREVVRYETRRERWRLAGCEVCLDELACLGWFLEIEGPSPAAVAAAREQLAVADRACLEETYVELAARHGRRADGGRRLVFDA